MQFYELTPMLWVPDLKESVAFYTEILDFTCTEYSEEWQWAAISRDNAGLMLAKPNEHTLYKGSMFTGSFYFRVDDVDALWNGLKDKVEIVYAIDNFEYGMREFAIKDTNGFMLQFGQEISKVN
jgi:uncharacterized glyoxalase superfamily protein PhnB